MDKDEELRELMNDEPTRQAAIQQARDEYQCDEIEIDEDAKISPNDEGGIWVQAWVYIVPGGE